MTRIARIFFRRFPALEPFENLTLLVRHNGLSVNRMAAVYNISMRTAKESRIVWNPFCRIDSAKHYTEWWHRRAFSRSMAAAVGLIALLFFLAGLARGQETGKVMGVYDGDTITVLTADKKELKIRMAGIDAPELKQDFGNKAKQNLSKLLYDKTVTLEGSKTDKYRRLVRKVVVDGVDANLAQVRAGFAWFYREYERELSKADRALYSSAEGEAQAAGRGLGSMPHAQPPWDFRHGTSSGHDFLKGKIVGNKNSRIYHWEGCQGFTKVGDKNRALFASSKEAEAAGYRPAKGCSSPQPN
jgi:endonuclease YncB( thermonuclease family)